MRAINVVGLEQYLYGVVPAEVPDDWAPEVLKAQAVAARSYALATRKTGGAFDLFPDVRSQVYRGVDEEEESTNAAVDETAGEVLMYGGRLVIAYFHSTSGGRTASVEDVWVGSKRTPYLTGVPDPYDSISPHHIWGPVVMPAGRLQRSSAPGRLLDVRTTTNASARADTVVGIGTGGEASARPVTCVARSVSAPPGSASASSRCRSPRSRTCSEARRGSRAPRALSTAFKRNTWGQRAGAVAAEARDGSFSVAVRPTAQYRLSLGAARTGAIRLGVAPQVRLLPVTDALELAAHAARDHRGSGRDPAAIRNSLGQGRPGDGGRRARSAPRSTSRRGGIAPDRAAGRFRRRNESGLVVTG